MCHHQAMEKVQTKLTTQGQVSVPASVRRLLNLTPGSVLVWSQEGGRIVVERGTRYTTLQAHQALFPQVSDRAMPAKTLAELKQGIRDNVRRRHALT
jgi:antitoxin PrlF